MAKTIPTPEQLFLNPFNRRSAHHRPIGTGARYAADDHPATKSWHMASTLGVNIGAPWGVHAVLTAEADPVMTVQGKAVGGEKVSTGFPAQMRLPKAGVKTKVALAGGGHTDGVVVIVNAATGRVHQLRQYAWNEGQPTAGQYKTWDLKGLGHGVKPGDRLGTSASGVAALFGVLRGFEINKPGHRIGHALQGALPAKHQPDAKCKLMLSREVVLPAVSKDGAADLPDRNTGNIPYGALFALPPDLDLDSLGLSEPGRRLAQALRDYGFYAVDMGGCANGALRADQHVSTEVAAKLKADLPKLYKRMRMVLNNNVLGSETAGGGKPLGPNTAYDVEPDVIEPPPPVAPPAPDLITVDEFQAFEAARMTRFVEAWRKGAVDQPDKYDLELTLEDWGEKLRLFSDLPV